MYLLDSNMLVLEIIYSYIYIYLYLYLYIFAVLASHARIPTLCNRQKRCKLRNTSPNLDQLGAANKYKNIYCGLTERTSKRESKRYIITNIQIYKNFLCEKSKIHTTRTEHSIKIHTLFTKHQSQKVYAFQELKHRNIYIYFIYIYIYACNLYISYDSCENNPRTHTFQKHHVFKIAYCCGNFPFT